MEWCLAHVLERKRTVDEIADWSCQWQALKMSGRGYHVYKYVWDLSQKLFHHRWMFFHRMPSFLSVGRTLWYRTTRCFCFTVHWHRIDLTFVCSSPYAGTCGAINLNILLVFLHLAIAFERVLFLGLPIGHLTVFPLSIDLKEAAT